MANALLAGEQGKRHRQAKKAAARDQTISELERGQGQEYAARRRDVHVLNCALGHLRTQMAKGERARSSAAAERQSLADEIAARMTATPRVFLGADVIKIVCDGVQASGGSLGGVLACGGLLGDAAASVVAARAREHACDRYNTLALKYSQARSEHLAYLCAWAPLGFQALETNGEMQWCVGHLDTTTAKLLVGYVRVLTAEDNAYAHAWRWLFATLLKERRADIDRPSLLSAALQA